MEAAHKKRMSFDNKMWPKGMNEYNEASLADQEKVVVVGMADVLVHNSACTPI